MQKRGVLLPSGRRQEGTAVPQAERCRRCPAAPRQHPRERCTCAPISWAALLGSRVVSYRSPRRTKKAKEGKTRGEPKKPSAASQKKKKRKKEPSTAQTFSSWIPQKKPNKKKCRVGSFPASCRADPAVSCGSVHGLPPVPRRERRLTALRGARQPARARRTSARAAPRRHPPEPRRPHTYPRLMLRAAGASRRRRGRRRNARRRHSRSPPGSAGPPRGEGAARGAT